MGLHGVLTMARLELMLRVRTGRWRRLLVAWFVVCGAVTFGIHSLVTKVESYGRSGSTQPVGVAMYGGLMLFVLGLALLVVPALTAQSINGDRERGVLATLQVTLLTPYEIAVGKLVAAWGVAVVFLATTTPWVVWSYVAGGVSIAQIAGVSAVMVALLGVFCGISLGLSALLSRTTTSGVLSYLAVFGAVIGTLIVFGIGVALSTEKRSVPETYTTCDEVGAPCTTHNELVRQDLARPDRVWWLLAPNPFVVLADAAPVSKKVAAGYTILSDGRRQTLYENPRYDVLSAIGNSVREVRKDPVAEAFSRPSPGKPLWHLGLAVDILLGAGMTFVAARRLRTPSHKLPRGQRVA